jgi:hypothetical protein
MNTKAHTSDLRKVDEYLQGAFKEVQGWCAPQLWNVIQPIHEFQESLGCNLPIAEIGVYHGKFFIGLALTKQGAQGHHVIDVFDLQQFNLDGAGKGSLERLKANLSTCGVDAKDVRFHRADSMTLNDRDIDAIRVAAGGGFSMFSVDGCHMVEHTINDFRVAMQLTCPEGVIFVDDYSNPDWPGVHEGMAKLFHTDSPRFVPLAFLSNKLVLCHISHHDSMLEHLTRFLKANAPSVRTKIVQRFGYKSVNVHVNLEQSKFIVQPPH